MQLSHKRPPSARKVRLTYDALIANGTPSLEVVEVALFYLPKRTETFVDVAAHKVEIAKLETLRAQLAAQAQAWGGFVPLETVAYQVPGDAVGGTFRILAVRMPPDSPPYFLGLALTDLFDWSNDGRKVAAAGDPVEILTVHVVKKPEKRHAIL